MNYNLQLGFEYQGFDVKFDTKSHGRFWFVNIDGQDRRFDDPIRTMRHIDKVVAMKPLVGKEVIAYDNRRGTKRKIKITGTYYHDIDDGAPMGLFLMDQKNKPIDRDNIFLKEENLGMLEEYIELEKQADALREKCYDVYHKLKEKDAISEALDMSEW